MTSKKIEPFTIQINTDKPKTSSIFDPPRPIQIDEPPRKMKKFKPPQKDAANTASDQDRTFRSQDESMRNYYLEQKPNTYGSYTMVPNSLLDVLPKHDFTRTAHRLMWLIIRKTIGFHKDDTPISIDYMRKCTGITSKSNVIKGLKQIEEAGLVTTYYDEVSRNKHVVLNPTIFEEFKSIKQKKIKKEGQQNSQSQNRTSHKAAPVINYDQSHSKTSPDIGLVTKLEDVVTKSEDVVTKQGPNKEKINKIKEIFLSYDQDDGIKAFFLRKRELSKNIIESKLEQEFYEYNKLLETHPKKEICEILNFIEKEGGVGAHHEGKKINFPFKYLNSGGLEAVTSKIKRGKTEHLAKQQEQAQAQQKQIENASIDLKQKQYRYFELKYPDEKKQRKILENIIRTELDNALKKQLKGNEVGLRVAAKEYWIENHFTVDKYNALAQK